MILFPLQLQICYYWDNKTFGDKKLMIIIKKTKPIPRCGRVPCYIISTETYKVYLIFFLHDPDIWLIPFTVENYVNYYEASWTVAIFWKPRNLAQVWNCPAMIF